MSRLESGSPSGCIKEVPELRIVDDELWQAARRGSVRRSNDGEQPKAAIRRSSERPKYLFSGLTKCGECGGGFIMYSRDRLGCFGARDRGTCTNHLTIRAQEVEARVLRALQEKLLRQDCSRSSAASSRRR